MTSTKIISPLSIIFGAATGRLSSTAELADTLVAAVIGLQNPTQIEARVSSNNDGIATIAPGGLYAPRRHSYRLVALSRRLPGCQFQSPTPDPLRADPGARPLRRLEPGHHLKPRFCA